MLSLKYWSAIALMLTLAVVFGCSGSSGPVSPIETSAQLDSVPVIGLTDADGVYNMVGMMGAYEINLDMDNMTADLVVKRNVAIGESYIVSGLGFFNQAPCTDCLKIAGLNVVTDIIGTAIKVQFNISHPFAPGNPAQPPTAVNRLDLDVFDVAMVIVPTAGSPVTYPLTAKSAYTNVCAYADGYTTELAAVTGDNAACPYFLVIDDAADGANTNNKFAMGTQDELFDVFFRQGGAFDMYLTFGYGFSARKMARLNPKYYIPEFNRKAAWKVEVEIPSGENPPAMGNTWDDSDITTEFDLVVNVYDWQQGVAASTTNPYEDETDTSLVFAVSNVSQVSCEIPGMYSPIKTLTNADSGAGTPSDPLVYTFSIANENGLSAGTYYGMIKVADERVPAAAVGTTDYIIDSPDGIALNEYTIPEFATYQIFPAIVVVGCGPVSGEITSPVCPVTGVFNGAYVSFAATASSANGGNPIVLYEWDMDYDGVTFNVTATGQNASLGPFTAPDPCVDNVPYDFTVAVRATDSCNPANVEIIDTCTVTIENCDVPVTPLDDPEPVQPESPDDDEWFDIDVIPGGNVYVVADWTSTGNDTNTTRTVVIYDNDLTNPVVLNEGTGMCRSTSWTSWEPLTTPFNRIGVSHDGAQIANNPHQASLAVWNISGNTATSPTAEYGAYAVSCGSWIYGITGMHDVWRHASAFSGELFAGYEQITDCGAPYDATMIMTKATPPAVGFGYMNAYYTTATGVKAVEGFVGTDNLAMFYETASVAYVNITGSWYNWGGMVSPSHNTFGTKGTDDGEFTGALALSIDSAGNIVTLENHGAGVFRFQKFDSAGTWQWSSPWIGAGNPLRMAFDTSDDTLYVLSDTHITKCNVL